MVASENKKFFNNDGSEFTFDFENFIKNELGIGKKTGKIKINFIYFLNQELIFINSDFF
jgi:hypothetical protein